MNKKEFTEIIADVIQFLKDVDAVIPNKIDEEMIVYLETLTSNEWGAELLLNSINSLKDQSTRKTIR